MFRTIFSHIAKFSPVVVLCVIPLCFRIRKTTFTFLANNQSTNYRDSRRE